MEASLSYLFYIPDSIQEIIIILNILKPRMDVFSRRTYTFSLLLAEKFANELNFVRTSQTVFAIQLFAWICVCGGFNTAIA